MTAYKSRIGFTLVELQFAIAITSIVLAGTAVGIISLQRSFAGSKQYAAGMNDGCRLIDYISRDLRNALKVSQRHFGVATPFKVGSFDVTDSEQLVIFIPDYFVSNSPDNSSGSDYKLPMFSRSRLPAGQSYFPYNEVVTVKGVERLPRYPGGVEVRYLKRARSAQDPTICYFRQEYAGGVLRQEQDIAEKAETGKLKIQAIDQYRFRILTNFGSQWSGEAGRPGTHQVSTVQLFNRRRD